MVIAWYENNGASTPNFTAHIISTMGGVSVVAADLDGDQDVDVISASDDTVQWFENSGPPSTTTTTPTFTAHVITTTVESARSVTTADLDSDSDLDVLSASSGDNTLAYYSNDCVAPGSSGGGGGGSSSSSSFDATIPIVSAVVVVGVVGLLVFCLMRRSHNWRQSSPKKDSSVEEEEEEDGATGEVEAVDALKANGMELINTILTVAEAVPGIGEVCAVAKAILDECVELKAKAQDIEAAARCVVNTLDILETLTQNAAEFDPNDNAAAKVERTTKELHAKLTKFQTIISSFRDQGWFHTMWYTLGTHAQLSDLDDEIRETNEKLWRLYNLAKDRHNREHFETLEKKLFEERRTYDLQDAMRRRVSLVASEKAISVESAAAHLATDGEAIEAVAEEGNVTVHELLREVKQNRDIKGRSRLQKNLRTKSRAARRQSLPAQPTRGFTRFLSVLGDSRQKSVRNPPVGRPDPDPTQSIPAQ